MTPEAVLAWLGGPSVQHPTGPPTSTDPLDHEYGFYFAWPTCPALGREARALLHIVRPILARYGCPELMAFRFVTGRSVVLVMRIAFDRKRADRRAAARECHHAIVDATLAAGFPPARMAIDGMNHLDPGGDSFWQVVRRLKDCLDPTGILAPGRYLPPAPAGDATSATSDVTGSVANGDSGVAAEEHKVLVRRFFEEVFTRWDLAAVEVLLAPAYRQHDPVRPAPLDREDLKLTYPLFRAAFPDLEFTVEDLVGEGDRIAARYSFRGTHLGAFRGMAPTGRRVAGTGIAIFRIAAGAIAEVWANWDQLGLLQQLGLAPATG